MRPSQIPSGHVDVLIVGAGISGIGMAAYMRTLSPDRSFAIVERRARMGGTWDLFRYPGVRSDSDMYTLGYSFEPWTDPDAIAGGERILAYLDRVADKYRIRERIRLETKVVMANFVSEEARWHVTLEDKAGRHEMTANFLYLGAGYYDYDTPYDAAFPQIEKYRGTIVHPQFWPPQLKWQAKRVVVIGSGATAVTLVPALAQSATHVTMLQRTPTWMGARPTRDRFARTLQKILPSRIAYRLIRTKNVLLQNFIFKHARRNPQRMSRYLSRETRKALGTHYSDRDWLPPYGPWQQRLCLVPDGDLFAEITAGRASVITAEIERFDETGIVLESGEHLDADIVVTATGLKLAIAGHIAVSVDGRRIQWRKHFYYRSCMFSNVPNLAVVFGYLNASWTLRAESTARYVCEVLNHMRTTGTDMATPVLPHDHALQEADVYEFSSGYIQRARPLMPKSADRLPWRLNQDYRQDRHDFRTRPVNDGTLEFARAHLADRSEFA